MLKKESVSIKENDYINKVIERITKDGFEIIDATILDQDVKIGTSSKFKLTWFATKLYIFVIMKYKDRITRDYIKQFSKMSLDYAIDHKVGLPRGLQAGMVAFSLLYSEKVDEEAIKWVQKPPSKHFAAMEFPVIFDLNDNEIYYLEKTPAWGAIYYGFFREFTLKNLKP
jgi:hypothetical protein